MIKGTIKAVSKAKDDPDYIGGIMVGTKWYNLSKFHDDDREEEEDECPCRECVSPVKGAAVNVLVDEKNFITYYEEVDKASANGKTARKRLSDGQEETIHSSDGDEAQRPVVFDQAAVERVTRTAALKYAVEARVTGTETGRQILARAAGFYHWLMTGEVPKETLKEKTEQEA